MEPKDLQIGDWKRFINNKTDTKDLLYFLAKKDGKRRALFKRSPQKERFSMG